MTLASRPFAMIVEHTESFQAWLSRVLKPLCDADPGALAKYVLALIKKDKTEKELRQSMIDQLDVFLQSETKPFVDKLFEALNTKEYLNAKSGSSEHAVSVSKGESVSSGEPKEKSASTEPSSKAPSSKSFISSLTPVSLESDSISSTSGPTSSVNANQATSSQQQQAGSGGSNNETGALSSSSSSSKKGSNTLSVTPSALLNTEATTPPPSSNVTDSKEEQQSTNVSSGTNKNASVPNSSSASSGVRPRDRREDDRDKNRRKRSRNERDRRTSRSRSADRGPPSSKRSRSPRLDRERERERNDRPLRHRLGGRKSPPPRHYGRDTWDRRRSRSPILGGRNRSCSPRNPNRSRSPPPPRYRRPYNSSRSRSRSPLLPRSVTGGPGDRSRSPRSRSRSPHAKDSNKDANSKKDSLLPIPSALDADLALKELTEKGGPLVQSVVVRPGSSSADPAAPGASTPANNRCRDFDEKGLCMRGELCPFDHGKDPVVLEDIVVPNVSSGGPGGYGQGGRSMVPGGPGYNPGMVRPAMIGEYYPDNPSLEPPPGVWSTGAPPFRPRHPLGFDPLAGRGGRGGLLLRASGMGPYPVPGGQRQLISVPVVGGGQLQPGAPGVMGCPPPGMPPMMPHPGLRAMSMRGGHRGGRGGFDHGRLGAKPSHHHGHHHHNPHRNYTNCSLEVRKIPREQNTIMDLNSHFLRFGKIINIQINYDSDPEAALVTFSSPAEAQLAYRSTEAVLNNRFIRVFWHNKEKENDEEPEGQLGVPMQGPGSMPARIPVKERLGAQTHDQPMEHEKILLSGNNLTKTVYNNAALLNKSKETTQEKLQTVESIKRSQEMLAAQCQLKSLQDHQRAEALKMSTDLRKRKQTMMEEQIGQQKKLITKLESGSLSAKEKEETLKILKVLQDSVAKLKKDLDDSNPAKGQAQSLIIQKKPVPAVVGANARTKEEAQKEMLDAELDLINKEQQGGDTIDLQKKVLELRARAKSLGLIGQGAGRGRGGFRGMGRGFGGRGRGIIRGRGRGSVRASRSVDRRPTKIRITGFPASKLGDILTHFSVFGHIRDYASDANVPMMIVDFDTRKCAEVAMANGQTFEDTKLSVEWVTENAGEGAGTPAKGLLGSSDTTNNGEESNHHHDDLENSETIDEDDMDNYDELGAILGTSEIGEDEDEDDDDRSWRR